MIRLTGRWRPLWSLVGLLVAYFAVPLDWNGSTASIVLGLALTSAGLVLLGWMMVAELLHMRAGDAGRATGPLMILLALLVMTFSLAFYLVDLLSPRQMAGLSTRTDALYFTLSTMTTIGYGDVHAEGQVARALVCGLIVFNVVVVASLLRAHGRGAV
ncbi:MAG: potassium channel family protein [Aeromicrobium sp.]